MVLSVLVPGVDDGVRDKNRREDLVYISRKNVEQMCVKSVHKGKFSAH